MDPDFFPDDISGDPIRKLIGLDPFSPQGIVGEVVSPVATAFKLGTLGAKLVGMMATSAKALAAAPFIGVVGKKVTGIIPTATFRDVDNATRVVNRSGQEAADNGLSTATNKQFLDVPKGEIIATQPETRALAAREFSGSNKSAQRKLFSEAIDDAKASMRRQDAVQVDSLPANFKGQTFLTDDGLAGFTITKDGTLENLFRHPDAEFSGVMGAALTKARAAGARNLEAFDTYLAQGYVSRGAVETGRTKFNPEFATPEIQSALGEKAPDFVQMNIGGVIQEQKFSTLVDPLPQTQLERAPAPRGEPKVIADAFNKQNIVRLQDITEKGIQQGGERWYWMAGLLDQFIIEFGPKVGVERFDKLMDFNAALSPRSAVTIQVKRSSVLYQRWLRGDPFTPLSNDMFPKGYGHLATSTAQAPAVERLERTGNIGSSIEQPKIVSYTNNMKGNYAVLTSDGHNNLIVTGRKGSPTIVQYPFIEGRQQDIAREMGLDAAEFQSGLWVGGGDITKVRDTRNLPAIFNQSIARVAEDLDIPEQEALVKFMNGDVILKSLVMGVGASLAAGTVRQGEL